MTPTCSKPTWPSKWRMSWSAAASLDLAWSAAEFGAPGAASSTLKFTDVELRRMAGHLLEVVTREALNSPAALSRHAPYAFFDTAPGDAQRPNEFVFLTADKKRSALTFVRPLMALMGDAPGEAETEFVNGFEEGALVLKVLSLELAGKNVKMTALVDGPLEGFTPTTKLPKRGVLQTRTVDDWASALDVVRELAAPKKKKR